MATAIGLVEADQAPLLARPYFSGGDPGPIVGALAQVPELLVVAMPFVGVALGPSAISWRHKEIVIVRTSALAGCRFCVQSHSVVALDAGLDRDQVAALRDREPGVEFTSVLASDRERALVSWVDAVAGLGAVDRRARDDVLRHWAEYEVVELTAVVGATLMLNRFATALALPTSSEVLDRLDREGLR